jgi:A/G-specific adenine glycosylase
MLEGPSTPWTDEMPTSRGIIRAAPVRASWWEVPGRVVHTFTHFRLELSVYRAIVPLEAELTFWAEAERCSWVHRRDLSDAALPTVMRKVVAHALKQQ